MDFTRFKFLIYDTAKTPNEFSNITIEMKLKGLLHDVPYIKKPMSKMRNGDIHKKAGSIEVIQRISHNFIIFSGIPVYMIFIQLMHFRY